MHPHREKTIIAFMSSIALAAILSGCGSSVTPIDSGGSVPNSNNNKTPTWVDLGNNPPVQPSPTPPPGGFAVDTPWSTGKLAEGDTHSCMLDTGGGVWCWGHNNAGQLGLGDTKDREWVTKNPSLGSGVKMIAAGGDHTCALDSMGGVWCWGSNNYGQLGDGTKTDRYSPVKIASLSSGVKALSIGWEHSCAVDSGNNLWCWGSNAYGQLGTGGGDSLVPTVVGSISGVKALSAGKHHTCATNGSGGLFCWGYNNVGWLGDGTTTNRPTPTQVWGMTSGIVSVSAGYGHTCAVDSTGALWCWGSNYYGALGTGAGDSSTPVRVTGITGSPYMLAAGGYHTCISDGNVYVQCWGYNYNGQVGNQSKTNKTTPAFVNGLSGTIRGLAAGGYHNCVFDGAGMQCWGSDYYSQLGDGTYTDQTYAVHVAGTSH